jgi:hypothetical protein
VAVEYGGRGTRVNAEFSSEIRHIDGGRFPCGSDQPAQFDGAATRLKRSWAHSTTAGAESKPAAFVPDVLEQLVLHFEMAVA